MSLGGRPVGLEGADQTLQAESKRLWKAAPADLWVQQEG